MIKNDVQREWRIHRTIIQCLIELKIALFSKLEYFKIW